MKTYGRTVIYANYTEEELLSKNIEELEKIIIDIIQNSASIHTVNQQDTNYLYNYLYGDQDIKFKEKKTRTDINNRTVENWAFAFNDWKKTFLLGKPIQYAPIDDTASEEITKLNKYNTYEDKEWLDQEIYEDMFIAGRGFRYTFSSPMNEDDEAPFELLNLDFENTEVVYSSSINHEQLLSYIVTSKRFIDNSVEPEKEVLYDEYTVYTRQYVFVVNNMYGEFRVIGTPKINMFNDHVIHEYYLNRKRIGLLEIAKEIFDDINYVENLDMDDIEAFVNSIMVFTNAEVNAEAMEGIKEYGAVSIKSTDQKKASVELLQSRLKSLDTQIFYLRKLSALHTILAVPEASSGSSGMNNAETGKAMMTSQGFTSANIRVEGEEKAFKRCDRECLKLILKICKANPNSGIKNLKVTDIESKFNRDLSDNLMTKTQALLNLTDAKIPPEIRNQVIGLFSDPVSVTKLQKAFEEEQRQLQEELVNRQNTANNNGVKQQNNKISSTQNNENQEQ